MIQEYDMWNPKDLGYGFEWDGHWFYWSPPEVAPVLQTLLVAIGGVLLVALPTGIVAAAFSDAMQRRREAMARALEEMEGALPE